jgi:hypothetical protein
MGLLELAGEAGRRHDIAGAPDRPAALWPSVVNTVSQRPEALPDSVFLLTVTVSDPQGPAAPGDKSETK